jgi:hypothetical protein
MTCDPQDEAECREEISNAQDTLGAYKILTEKSCEKFEKMTCLSDFSGLPDISCTSFQDNPREKRLLKQTSFMNARSLQQNSTPTELVTLENRGK